MSIYSIIVYDGISQDFVLYKAFLRWFCFALFISKTIYWLLTKFIRNNLVRSLTVVSITILACILNQYDIGANFLYYKHGMAMLVFIEFGQRIKNSSRNIFTVKNTILFAAVFMIAMSMSFYILHGFPIITSHFNVNLSTLFLHWILSISGALVILGISRAINQDHILEKIGQDTLMIYILHFFFIEILIRIFKSHLYNGGVVISLFLFVLFYSVSLFGSLVVSRCLDNRYLLWMKGK